MHHKLNLCLDESGMNQMYTGKSFSEALILVVYNYGFDKTKAKKTPIFVHNML